jgi:cell division protein FtsI (penicillin-binding protein 3)
MVALDGPAARRRTLRRLAWLVVVMVAVAAGIAAKMATVQIAQRDRWQAWGLDQRDGWREIPAGRGAIYDRTGQPLALSVVRPDVVADPANVRDAAATARTLAPVLGRSVADLEADLSGDGNYALLAPAVEPEVAARIERLRDAEDERSRTDGQAVRTLEGVVLKDRFVRFYPAGDLATAVVGRTVAGGGVDEAGREGVSGIEAQFDAALTGEPGRLQYEHDPSGRTIAGGTQTIDPARPGTDVYLTIDQSLQYEADRAIADQVEATGATAGMVLMMRPSTGEILAMSSVALDADGDAVNTRDNKPVTAVFEPGSVNKVITVAGALEEGLVEPDTVLEVPDHLTIYDKTFSDHDPHPVRAWSVTDILVTSSNIGTIKLAQTLGREQVDGYLRSFGLGETTGLGFPNEENGIMLPLEDWSGTSIGAIPIGQGIAVTALQMLSAYNVIANDGVYVAPRLVAATDGGGGRVEVDPAARRRVVSADTARAVQEMLEKVVTEGTGKRARVPDYPAAGKTGTARIPQGVDPSDGYRGTDGRYHYQSTFLGFVSGADLSILVTLEDPQTSTYGGEVAAPVFSELAGIALLRSQTPPPALLDRSAVDVPELSATARVGADEDAGPTTSVPAG